MATHKPAVIISGTAQDLPAGDGLESIASIEGNILFNAAGDPVAFQVEGDTATNLFIIDGGADSIYFGTTIVGAIATFTPFQITLNPTRGTRSTSIYGTGGTGFPLLSVSGSQVDLSSPNSTNLGDVAHFAFSGITLNGSGADTDVQISGDTLSHMIFTDASAATENIALVATAAPNWQSMDRGLFIGNASTAPTGNPTGGVFFYSDSGTLKYRKPDGSVITLGSGTGDIVGPASSNDHSIARFDGTTGKLLQDSVVNISDAGAITSVASIEGSAGSLAINDAGNDVDFRVEGDSLSHMLFVDASAATENIALIAGSAPNWQSMDGGLFIGNTSTAPTGNPSAGVFLWSEAGELRARDGGGTVTTLTSPIAGMSITGTKSANYTAANGEHVVCDTDAAAGNFTVTLPASPAAGDMVRVSIIKDHATRIVDIGRNGSNIQGGTAVDRLRLCLEGDTTLFTYVGSDCGWQADIAIRAHSASLVRATAQTGVANDTDTKTAFDTSVFDIGGLADLTNDWVLIRRSGLYTINSFWGLIDSFTANERVLFFIRVFSGGSSTSSDNKLLDLRVSNSTNPTTQLAQGMWSFQLNAGDKVEMRIEQTTGGTISTSTNVVYRPTLSIAELR